MKRRYLITAITVATMMRAGVIGAADRTITCKACKMHGVANAELARQQRAIAKTVGKQICPNCAGLASAARFGKDGTIFQGNADFVCSGCEKKK